MYDVKQFDPAEWTSPNPKVQGFDGATMSFVEYLYELAK